MPPHGSAYSLAKSAIVFALEARESLAEVGIRYQAPTRPEEITGPTGRHELIHLDRADGEFNDVVFTAGRLVFDETFTLDLVIQVLKPGASNTQQAADERAEELLFEVLAELSRQQEWSFADLDLDQFDYFQLTPQTQRWEPGHLDGTDGYATGCRLGIQVRARRSFQ